MKAISESLLQSRLGSGSTERLRQYRQRLSKGRTERVYDKRAVGVFLKYALHREQVFAELRYLETLKDADGVPFSRSYGLYPAAKKQLDNFKGQEKSSFRWNRHFQKAEEIVKERYSKANLVMREYHSDNDVYESVTDWDTSSGWERILDAEKAHKRDVLSGIFLDLKNREARAVEEGSFNAPIICTFRTQGSGAYTWEGERTNSCKHKIRLVCMVDVYLICSESRFGSVLNQWLKHYGYTAIGKDDQWILNFVARQRASMRSFISLDYSRYDSTIPSWLIRSAFDVLRSAFKVYDEKLLSVIEEDFINKNFVTAEGVFHASHGNPSGSRLTAIINGICNELITETWMQKFGLRGKYNIMGDDNLIYLDTPVDMALVASISQYIVHNFGVQVNAEKSSFGSVKENPEYLSREWTPSGAWRAPGEVISLLAYPEKKREYWKMAAGLGPELVLYSYILAYPVTMRELMDVDAFLRDTQLAFTEIKWTKEQREAVPYNVRVKAELDSYRGPSYLEVVEAVRRKHEGERRGMVG